MSRFFLITLLFTTIVQQTLLGVPDATSSAKDLTETMEFLKIINTGISNFGNQDHKKRLKAASEKHFRAHFYYVSQNYQETFNKVRESQAILKDLYSDFLIKYYFDYSKYVLTSVSPKIILNRDKHARKFLKLGFRDLSESKKLYLMGENSNKFLYSLKIHYFIDAMKLARRAKRYAFLAVAESNTPMEDRTAFKKQTIDDFINPDKKDKLKDFERVYLKLKNIIERKLVKNDLQYFLNHYDNYGFIKGEDILKNHRIAMEGTDWGSGPENTEVKEKSGTNKRKPIEKKKTETTSLEK